MTKSRSFQVVVCLAIVVFFACGQQALAQHHLQVRVVSGTHADGTHPPRVAKERKALEQLIAGFGVLPPIDDSGNDEWPCFPGGGNPNDADCASIAAGGVVLGQPAFTQSLSACDANTGSSPNCGQIFSFYEDDTGDNNDNLIVSVVVKQGAKYILNTGQVNLGLNPFAAGSVIVIYDDTAFGTLGQTGPNNGFCAGSNLTCVDPVSGKATITFTITVGTSTIKSTSSIFFQ